MIKQGKNGTCREKGTIYAIMFPIKEYEQEIINMDKAKVPVLDTAIKVYHVNKDNDVVVYGVFAILADEEVYLPVNEEGKWVSLATEKGSFIAVFSSPAQLGNEEGIILKPVYLRDYIVDIVKTGMNMLVNPFGKEECQFIVPADAIKSMLVPIMNREITL